MQTNRAGLKPGQPALQTETLPLCFIPAPRFGGHTWCYHIVWLITWWIFINHNNQYEKGEAFLGIVCENVSISRTNYIRCLKVTDDVLFSVISLLVTWQIIILIAVNAIKCIANIWMLRLSAPGSSNVPQTKKYPWRWCIHSAFLLYLICVCVMLLWACGSVTFLDDTHTFYTVYVILRAHHSAFYNNRRYVVYVHQNCHTQGLLCWTVGTKVRHLNSKFSTLKHIWTCQDSYKWSVILWHYYDSKY